MTGRPCTGSELRVLENGRSRFCGASSLDDPLHGALSARHPMMLPALSARRLWLKPRADGTGKLLTSANDRRRRRGGRRVGWERRPED
jgi:hypothetical protein